MKRNSRTIPVLAATGLLLLVYGCGGESVELPDTVPVTGTVTLDGDPVEGAQITLKPTGEGGHSARATSTADGTFEVYTYISASHDLEGAVPGSYQISVTKPSAAPSAPAAHDASGPPTSRAEAEKAVREQAMAAQEGGALPAKYASPTTSELTFTVSPDGENTLPLELTSE